MLLRSIYEGIRMGSSDLSITPKKDYTIGFEFEVALNSDDAEDFDIEDLADDFGPNVDTSDFMEEWFNQHIINGDLQYFVTENDIEPKYGYTTLSDDDITDIQTQFDDELIEKYGEDTVDEIQELLLDIKEEPNIKLDEDQLYTIFETYFKALGKTPREEQVQRLVNNTKDRVDINEILVSYLVVLEKTFLFDENLINSEDVQIYANEEKTETITFDDISDIDDFIKYFDISLYDIELILDNDNTYNDDLENTLLDAEDGVTTETSEIKTVRKIISSALQTDVGKHSSTTAWSVDEDGTIGVDAEIRSPILSIDQGYKDMNTVLNTINDTDMYTSHATGLHINIGTWNSDEYNNVDWLKFLIILNPSRILQQFSRSNNQFAMDKLQGMVNSLKEEDFRSYANIIKDINKTVIQISEKYSAVNLSKLPSFGYIELRAPGNEGYEKRGDEITALIRKTIRALELATDPTAFKQQYLKKLFTLSSTTNPKIHKPNNIYDFFLTHTNIPLLSNRPIFSLLKIIEFLIENKNTLTNMDKTLTTNLSKELISIIKGHVTTNQITTLHVNELQNKLNELPSGSKTVHLLSKLTNTLHLSLEASSEPSL